MSYAETPAQTDAERILDALGENNRRLDALTLAVNSNGANTQWLVDNVQHIFQMFGSPQFMAMLGNMNFGGLINAGHEPASEPASDPASEPASGPA